MGDLVLTSAELLRQNVCETYLRLGRNAPGAKVVKTDRWWQCTSTFGHPIANFAERLCVTEDDLPELLLLACDAPHFRIYVMSGDTPTGLHGLLTRRGLTERYQLVGMEFAGDAGRVRAAGTLGTARVEGVPNRARVAKFMIDNFFHASPRSEKEPLAAVLAASAGADHEFYIIEDESGLLAAASLSLSEGAAGLYNVCVRRNRRGHGIGSSLVSYAALEASSRGRALVLQCDGSLATWYRRLGFRQTGLLSAFSA